jgi:ferrous iron transport protein B
VISSVGVAKFSSAEKAETKPLKKVIQGAFTPLSAYAFMAFVLLYMPCMVVAVALRHEFGTWKWFGVTFAYQMVLAWGVALLIYQGGRLLGLGG